MESEEIVVIIKNGKTQHNFYLLCKAETGSECSRGNPVAQRNAFNWVLQSSAKRWELA
jgi:hypothetical protein